MNISVRPKLNGEIDLITEVERINQAASNSGLFLRLIGALAFWVKCPKYNYLHAILKREYTDIDFFAYYQQKGRIETFFSSLGFTRDRNLGAIPGIKRSIFFSAKPQFHIDVFYDELEMCHTLDLRGRLEIDATTIPITDLLLEKGQIVEINRKDLIDIMMLFLEYPLESGNQTVIDPLRINDICSNDWGWYRTLSQNLCRTKEMAMTSVHQLSQIEIDQVVERVDNLVDTINAAPKTMSWKLRAAIGDRMKWYRDVEEVG